MRWFELAAWQGNAAAQTSLGAIYLNGYGVERDFERFGINTEEHIALFHKLPFVHVDLGDEGDGGIHAATEIDSVAIVGSRRCTVYGRNSGEVRDHAGSRGSHDR